MSFSITKGSLVKIVGESGSGKTTLARQIAEKLNIPILDLAPIFTPKNPIEREPITLDFIQKIGANWQSGWDNFEGERAKWGYTFTFDGLHIMPEVAKEFAEYIVPFLEEEVL